MKNGSTCVTCKVWRTRWHTPTSISLRVLIAAHISAYKYADRRRIHVRNTRHVDIERSRLALPDGRLQGKHVRDHDRAPDAKVRIRLNSTVVAARHVGNLSSAKQVEVVYGRDQKAYTVRAKGAVLACWNMVIPYMCPELPAEQKEALHYGVKVPLVYTAVGLRNGNAFQKLGLRGVACPGMYHSSVSLDQAVNIGDYRAPHLDQPIVIRMLRTPCTPGLSPREQQRLGHYDLLSTSFETFERNIRDQLARVLGSGGFDPARDIEAIIVNRWPHGYAYEYNPLWDPDWPEGKRPCDIARKRFGRITIANADAAAAAYTDQAIDMAYRAAKELTEA